jgi:anti-anti-sigma factor
VPGPDIFTADHSPDERGYRLVMRGELDLSQLDVAEVALIAAEVEAGERMLILDLRKLDYCGSVALPLLAGAVRRSEKSGRVLLVLPSASVRRLFELAGVTDDFEIEEPSPDGDGARS